MQDVSKEWLEFLRGQFPAGSRIQTWELDDPRNTLKEAGTLEHIDDEGRFHARQSDGGERILTLGEEMFSVHPPEPSLLKLYMPMTVGFYEPDGWGNWDERERFLDSQEAAGYTRCFSPVTPAGRTTSSSPLPIRTSFAHRSKSGFPTPPRLTTPTMNQTIRRKRRGPGIFRLWCDKGG